MLFLISLADRHALAHTRTPAATESRQVTMMKPAAEAIILLSPFPAVPLPVILS